MVSPVGIIGDKLSCCRPSRYGYRPELDTVYRYGTGLNNIQCTGTGTGLNNIQCTGTGTGPNNIQCTDTGTVCRYRHKPEEYMAYMYTGLNSIQCTGTGTGLKSIHCNLGYRGRNALIFN